MNMESRETELERHWGWVFFAGLLLLLIGAGAIAVPYVTAVVSVQTFGWFLIVAGIAQLIFSFTYRESSNFFMYSFGSLLALLIGVLVITHPVILATAFTVLLALFFLIVGIFRIYSSIVFRFTEWGWALVGGIISLILGVLILIQWPESAAWVFGLFIGVELIYTGWLFILAGFVLRREQASK